MDPVGLKRQIVSHYRAGSSICLSSCANTWQLKKERGHLLPLIINHADPLSLDTLGLGVTI